MADCFETLRKKHPDIPEETIRSIIDNLEKIRGTTDFASRAKSVRSGTLLEAQNRAHQKMADAVAIKKFDSFIKRKEFKGDPNSAFLAKFSGVDFLAKEGNLNFESSKKAFKGRFNNMLLYGAGEDNLRLISDGKSDIDLATAVDRLNKNKSITEFPDHVQKVATAMRALNRELVQTLQDSGVVIKNREDYIARQSHSREKMVAAGFDTWAKDISQGLDKELTFGAVIDEGQQLKQLKQIFNKIEDSGYENTIGFLGGARTLHFKDGASWANYNTKYGHGTILDSIRATINSSSKAAAKTAVFGTTNAKKLWDDALLAADKEVRANGTNKEKLKWEASKTVRKSYGNQMFGHPDHPGLGIASSIARNVNATQQSALLGMATLSAITDFGFSAGSLRSMGATGLSPEIDSLKTFIKLINPKELQKVGRMLDMNFNSMIGEQFDRFGVLDGGTAGNGIIQKVNKVAMTATGLSAQSAIAKSTNAANIATMAASESGAKFNDITPRFKASLERFGIDSSDWEIIRQAKEVTEDGLELLTPERISDVPGISRKRANNLRTKYATFLADSSTIGSPESSGRERALLDFGTNPDTAIGAALRIASLFKSFSLAVPRVMRRIALNNPGSNAKTFLGAMKDTGDLAIFAATMTSVTVLSAAGIVVKNAIKGKETNVESGEFWLDAFSRGAVPLMYSYSLDAMRGEYNKYGRSFLKDLAGPTFGQLDDVASIVGQASSDLTDYFQGRQSGNSKAVQKAVRFVMRNTPGYNLPFVKPMLNKAFMTDFMEYLNPGYETRIRLRAAQKGTEFLFDPY